MLDIKLIRDNPKGIEDKLKTKDPNVNLTKILDYDLKVRQLKTKVENLKSARNNCSKEIGEKKRKGENSDEIMAKMADMANEIHSIDKELTELEALFLAEMSALPNLPMDDIKISPDPKENVITKVIGNKPTFSFPFKNHVELNEKLDIFDFKRGAKITGAGWPIYKDLGARLEWALINYLISCNLKNGFKQWMTPLLVRPDTLFGSGQLPKFEHQQFKLRDDEFHLYLIPTAEVSLNGLHSEEILTEEELPLKYMAYTPCFRREAGAAGANERGLIRTHQFNKVEMFSFCKPHESQKIFDEMVANAEQMLQGLGLHYRLSLLVTGDMSFASAKTIDVEVWLPGQDRYYEVSSISNCTDYQARRSNIRYREKGGKPEFVHTLNGSGLATSRLMVAILENNQNEDGSVNIPTVLQPYLDGLKTIAPTK